MPRMKLWSWQKENLPSIRHSVRTALAATASVIVARLVQMPEAYWAAIATLVVMQSSLGATLTLSIERVVARYAEAVLDALVGKSLNDIVNYCGRFCSHHFFLNLSKIDISENLRFLARSFSPSWVLTCSVESKPNSRMIKMNRIGVVLIVFSIIDKRSPRPGCRPEHRATDLRPRTRMKRSSLSLGRLDLSSYYFSQAFEDRHFRKFEIFLRMLGA